MKITIDDVLESNKKSIYDLIMEARHEATKRGIKANSIVINRGLVFVPGDPAFYPDMVCGLKSYVTAKELPEEYAFAVLHDPNRKPEPRWIPVSERLPENGETVICVLKRGECWVATWNELDDNLWSDGENWCSNSEVTHWMPLPELPKEDHDE